MTLCEIIQKLHKHSCLKPKNDLFKLGPFEGFQLCNLLKLFKVNKLKKPYKGSFPVHILYFSNVIFLSRLNGKIIVIHK